MLHVSRVFSKEARKKSLGFSLIEITVGLGVVSILALGSANMIVDVVKTQKTSESNVSVMRARKEFLFELKHWKKNKVPANIPVRLNAQMETSFTEAGVRSVEGVNIVVKVGGQLLKEGSIYTLGNTKFEVTKLTFSEAEKVYNDGTNTSYFGSIKMSTKNLTTGLVSPHRVLTSAILAISNAGTLTDITEYVTAHSSAADCHAIEDANFQDETGGGYTGDRCFTKRENIGTTDLEHCTAANGGGFPVFKNDPNGAVTVDCVKAVESVCMERTAETPGENSRRIFRGFKFVQAAAGNGESVGDVNCQPVNDPAAPSPVPAIVYSTQTAVLPVAPVGPLVTPYDTLAKESCNRLVAAGRVDPALYDCTSVNPGANLTTEYVPQDRHLVFGPGGTSDVKPAVSDNIPCQCGSGPAGVPVMIPNGSYCGYYFDGLQGLNNDLVATAVYQCNNGSLQIQVAGATPHTVNRPASDADRVGKNKSVIFSGGTSYDM